MGKWVAIDSNCNMCRVHDTKESAIKDAKFMIAGYGYDPKKHSPDNKCFKIFVAEVKYEGGLRPVKFHGWGRGRNVPRKVGLVPVIGGEAV